ncbi:gastrin-releasing peptide [Protopterus annectens]|uniref:gastrin-releasing peptide n=1 Tax=Protopterus annectens TaxID=7888 RepID=UPI001CFB400E|nr:gastrin-releasing peptide [Protopterus annectens]
MGCVLLFWNYRSLFCLTVVCLVFSEVHLGAAVPVQQNVALLSKIYPRGSHWAVGHLMGKKSTEEVPYGYKEGTTFYSSYSADGNQSRGHQHWVEILKGLLKILEESEDHNGPLIKDGLTSYQNKPWESADSDNFKEVVDFLVRIMNLKGSTQR